MTSPANQQNPQASNTSATTASYASAAGAPSKPDPSQPPAVATGSQPSVVVDSSASPAQNAKPVSPAPAPPVNGKTSASNGAHSRHSSVTMAANGPNSFAAAGGPAGAAKSNIQFGFGAVSPNVAASSPQPSGAAPIPIPGGAPRVASPAKSPSPIPQPSAGGGRPPSGLQQSGNQMTFGSLGSDGERHMRQGSMPGNQNAMGAQSGAHFRRESTHSAQGEGPGGPNRNFPPQQGGRARGGYNPHNNGYNQNNQMGYPPNNQFRNGHGQGRGMPASFTPQGTRAMPFTNSPQASHRSPAMGPAMPNTPTMQQNQPMPMNNPQGYAHYGPPMTGNQQNYGYPPPGVDQYGRPYNAYNMPQYMGGPPPAGSPGFNQGFVPPPHYHHQQSHSMSRTSSQQERPASANQQAPPVAMGSNNPQGTPNQAKSDIFAKPGRKSAAIPIKTSTGEVVDTSTFKVAPASPALSSQQAKTPPVVSSNNPTPSPKPAVPTHTRTDSQATRSASEIQEELKEKIRKATAKANQEPSEPEAKPEPKTAAAEPQPQPEAAPAPEQPAQEKAVEEPKKDEAKPAEAASAAAAAPAAPAAAKKDDEEDEMERMIREMEEADAAREAAEEEHRKKAAVEKEAAKKKEEENRKTNAADADRKLREQEREMERLEEEKEKKRNEAEASGQAASVADLLAGKSEPAKDDSKVESVTDKMAGMKIGDKPSSGESKPTTAEKRGVKPAALNLAPLNTKSVEPPQPSAALQSLKSARFLSVINQDIYPEGIKSPNPATNAAVAKKGKSFQYDSNFLLQFRGVFTEQPSVEFHQQVKSLIGDAPSSARGSQTPGSRQNSRPGGSGFQMGSFNNNSSTAPGGRTLPTNTTSEQRFAMSNNMTRPPPATMNSFNRPGGAFPMGGSMSRTASSSNMGPNSPRHSDRSRRGDSRRKNNDTAKDAKTMPLTAGQELKPIAVTSSGWKPTSVGRGTAGAAAGKDAHLDPEMVQRKVKAALNKMTPENFERISEQILDIASQSKNEADGRTLRQVIQLTFEKATDEAHWASMYAKFCKKMLESMSPEIKDERVKDKNGNIVNGGNLFRKYLLNRCQEDFERGWKTDIGEAPKEGEEGTKKSGEAEMLSDEYYKAAAAKRRGLGLVQLIGELYKLGMLTERIMVECVHKLVDYKGIPDEAEIESLCKLLRTIGQHLDASEKGHPMMDVYFGRIQTMIDLPELPSRLQFMLMDIVDLRKANWASKEKDKGPKTLEEVRAEAEAAAAAKAQEAARSGHRGGGGGRPPPGRGDARNFSGGYQQTSNQVGMDDLRRLKGTSRTTSGNVTLGPASMLGSRSNSGRRLGPGGALGRPGDESGASSRTGTPPVRDNPSHSNAFSVLANMGSGEHPASPPSTSASPNLPKAVPDSGKKDGE